MIRKVGILIVFFAFGTGSVFAQKKESHPLRGGISAFIKDSLALSPSQMQALKKNKKDFHQQLAAVRKDSTLNAIEQKQKIQAVNNAFRQQQEGLLTEDQKSKLEAWKKRNKMPKTANEYVKGKKNVFYQLNLSNTQKTQIQKIQQKYVEKMDAVKNDTTMTHQTMRKEQHRLTRQKMDALKKVLTPEQLAQLDSLNREKKLKKSTKE